MTKERYKELRFDENVTLTNKEIREGWHFCLEWDGMLINKYTSPEGKCCKCALIGTT